MFRYFGLLLALFVAVNTAQAQVTSCVPQDIMFMVDTSDGVGSDNFRKELEFIKSTINNYNISTQCIHIGLITFSGQVYNKFALGQYSTKAQIMSAIDQIQYQPGRRYTTEAIRYMNTQSFGQFRGARSMAQHIGILVTNGQAANTFAFQQEAQRAKLNGVSLYTVGIGQGVYQQSLVSVSSDPKSRYSMTAQTFDSLGDLAYPLSSRTSSESPQLPAATGCLQKADLVFVVDGSGSIGPTNFAKLQDFLKNIVKQLNVGTDAVHVGVMKFSNYPSIEFPLDMHYTRADVLKAIDNINYLGGGTNTAEAINYMNHQMFNQKSGARPNVPRISVVITDGRSSNPTTTASAANQARADHIGMMSIGIGAGVDQTELHAIANSPASSNSFMVNNYDQLNSIAAQIIQRACQVRAMAPIPTTAQPGVTKPDPCQDVQPNCNSYGDKMCFEYAPWAKDNCARFCGICKPLYTTTPPPCIDRLPDCDTYGLMVCHQSQYKAWAKDNCRRFCGFCGADLGGIGFYGKCHYKGKSYQHGQKWTDGCDYECVCEDGQTGRYKCYNRCPLYYNLPSECTLVRSPTKCCQEPVCNFNQKIQSFTSNSMGQTPSGMAVCAYKQNQYYQGQTWQDGCDYQCTCTNSATGQYTCQDLCPTYSSIPPYCRMTKKNGECCSKPVCDFTTQQGSFTGTGSISGKGVGKVPTTPPPCVDTQSNCERFGHGMCVNFTGWASDNCRKYCNLCNMKTTPGPEDKCMYDGHEYSQGTGWMVSCDTQCVCEDALYGYYRCTNICPKYSNLPTGCYETKKAGECCTSVQCDSGTILTSTNNLGTIGSGGLMVVKNPSQPQIIPTAPGGATPRPGTGGTGMKAPTLQGCLYKGELYLQGQMWDDGCQYSCVCKSAQNGYYECSSKCPSFPNLPVGCHMEADDSEPCCQKPKCIDPKTPVIPVFNQGTTGHGVVQPPSIRDLYNNTYQVHYTMLYGNSTVQPPTPGHSTGTGGIGYCMYKGQKHNQGDNWDDGCVYRCVCEDASIGKWRCRERCVKYNNLPKQCHLVTSKLDTCCKEPVCDFTGQINHFSGAATRPMQTQPPVITTTTPKPTPALPRMCVYSGKQYSQNQMWYDGCKYKCTCDNAILGFYRCTNRCPEYQNVPDACTMVPDTQDPACCKVPQCNFTPAPGGNTGTGGIVTLSPGSFQGSNPGGTNTNIGYCMYKGQKYTQGQKWDDGCQYKCECKDARSGLYKCDESCPRYGNLPYPCTLITDFRNPCCKVPDCTFNGQVGEITGTLTPAPHIGPTLLPQPGQTNPTPAPVLNYCLYKNVKYYQGQTWDDGCDKRCFCDDATRGLYTCNDRCPKYQTLPKECHLVTDQSDVCCQKPACDFKALLKNVTGTIKPNMIPTLAPPAQITGQVNTPTPRPGLTPKPITKCLYKGNEYNQGQRWDDGCQYTCVCVDAMKGKYACNEKCPKYPTLPPECSLQKDPANPCCYKPECIFNPNVNEITGQGTTKAPHVGPTMAPTPYTGSPTNRPYATPSLPKDVCVYKGKSYTQGQQWYDGCDYSCICENAQQGVYRCSRRCPEYTNVPKECPFVADDRDPLCCKLPKCQIPPTYNNQTGYVSIPTPKPGVITGGSVTNAPTPAPYVTPLPGQTNPTPGPTPAPKEVCTYKGRDYSQGQKWQDGCDYDCECVNAKMGFYKCTEKCPRYTNLPARCRLVADYLNPCCKKPYCEFKGTTGEITGTMTPAPGLQTTLVPLPNGQTRPTPQPTPKMPDTCLYNGVAFKQDQTWNDGCDLKCVCENGMTGFYRCSDRCAKYNSVPQGCTLVTDPADSCCRIPSCPPQIQPTPGITPSLGPGMTPNPNPTIRPPIIPNVPGVIIGQGVTPTPRPGMPTPATKSPPVPVCMYKGQTYTQGQKFDDGCDLHCECFDAVNGKYKCTKRCQTYVNLPVNCRLSVDPTDSCCKVATCSPTPSPNITPNPNVTPTPGPGQTGPTIAPNLRTTLVPNPFTQPPTLAPMPKDVCVMNGRQYTQGQTWYDGCQKKCVCEDGKTGFYRCSDRCREYKNVPPTCTMVPDPKDPQCCQLPQCIPGVNGNPTPQPQVSPRPGETVAPQIVTGQPLGVVTGFAPSPTPSPLPTLAPKPGQPNPTRPPTPAPKMVCVYKGKSYGHGQRWQDGCDYNCVCTDGMTGHYKCTERCPSYPAVPPYCHMETDPKDFCCQRPVCNFDKPIATPTPAPLLPKTVAPNLGTTQVPIPGQTTPTQAPVLAFCVYQGVPYKQSQTWNVGCDKVCRCDVASKNIYNCMDRCPTYKIQPGCTWVTDPADPCCQVPQCLSTPTPAPYRTPAPGATTPKGQTPTIGPNVTPTFTPYPSPLPQGLTGSVIGKPQVPSLRGTCEYMGKQYTKGQRWDDGCRYHCQCIDGMSGQYKCDERCPRYPSIPSYCVLVQDPKDPCCKTPSCSVKVPTPKPHVSPSPRPTQKPGPGQITPVPFTTLSPLVTPPTQPPRVPVVKDVCIMHGKAYTQGQRWDDGCDRVCVCDDGKTGHYSCSDRCPTYNNISPSCIMVADPTDPVCCKIPQCANPNNSTIPPGVFGQVTGKNPPTPTPGPNVHPTPGNQNTPIPRPNPYPTPYPGGTYPPGMLPTLKPTKAPQPGVQTPNPNPTPRPQPKACVYNGQQYSQGQRWRDGCKYNCICDDAMTGKYTCTDICARYPPLPANCRMAYDATNPCCKKPDCSNPTPNPLLTPSPGPNVTPNPLPTRAPKLEFCIYNGVPYRQGQSWQAGCSKTCRCEDAAAKQVTCTDRCPTYPQLQPGCTYVTDPRDPCCQTPQCRPNPNTKNPTAVITGPKGIIDGSNVIKPNQPNPGITGKSNVCLYNGKIYTQGQTWDDGCTYHCVCIDASTGHYQCTEKCFKIPQLPSYCTLIQDPQNQCCQLPYCQAPTPSPNKQPTPGPGLNPSVGPTLKPNPLNTPTPGPGQITLAPRPKDVCVYKGNMYHQNQVWYDDCNAKCRCENANTGYYRCQERCARYTNVPTNCIMVADPTDPTCCKVPQCPVQPTAGPTPTPGFIPNPQTPQPGVITGLGPVIKPTLSPPLHEGQTTLAPQPRTGCSYRGLVYQKGQKWADGCQYDCECLDDMTGQYRCVEKCFKFPNLDSRCVLIQDPKEPCCQKPYCDFVHPTPFPNGIPTPNPAFTPTPRPGQQPTPRPNPNTVQGKCVYKGVFYSQGQTWNDGCDYTCQCDDAMNNLYSCHQRCKVYSQVPQGCKLTTDPNDQCCLIPNCNINLFPQKPGIVTGPTSQGITLNPQYNTGPSGTRPQYVYPTPILPGTFTGTSGTGGQNPLIPNPGNTFSGSNNGLCIYKGKTYSVGQKWDDGCSYRCECVDATRGQYRCTDRCPSYPFLPPQCTYIQDPNDQCCQMARCNAFATPSPKPTNTPTPGVVTTHKPLIVTPNQNTGPTGTVKPPVVTHSTVTGRADMCLYKGQLYSRGQRWQDGCNYNCRCLNPVGNQLKCAARCKSYSSIPSYCTLQPDPNDQCCSTVRCTAGPNGQQLIPMIPDGKPTPSPTLSPSKINVIPVGTHTVITGSGLPNGQIPGMTGGRSVCIYHGQAYNEGQSWDDGCKYVCTCEDGSTGMYKCTSKCPKYPALPTYCSFTSVPGQCCPSLHCNSPTIGNYNPNPQLVPTPRPNIAPTPGQNPYLIVVPGQGTITSGQGPVVTPGQAVTSFTGNTNNLCIYKGKVYNKGDKWDDGCDYKCECLEGRSGYYQCKPLCPKYTNMPSQCYVVTPAGECCAKPMCTGPTGNQINPLQPGSKYPVYGSYGGGYTGFRPNYRPGQSMTTGNRSNVCIYKGRIYKQGQRWEDGCDFSCTCVDSYNGQYRCTEKCPTYKNIPSQCRMYDVPGDCCKEVRCDMSQVPTTPIAPTPRPNIPQPHIDPNCYDTISNCKAYGQDACSATYDAWSKSHCALYCGHCTPTVTSGPVVCADKLTNCAAYDKSACQGQYKSWALDNCMKYCGLCPGNTVAPPTAAPRCVDKLNCQEYGQYVCRQPYLDWAQANCRKYCNFCQGTGVTSPPQVQVALPGQGWMIMMKGVSGVPGDLFQIWRNPTTVNQNVPQAMYLTSQFPGHYKPDLANHWSNLCIDKVKVAIYNNGVEKANIVFNAIGANKDSWFDKSRIISSTYTDIQNAPKEFFSMIGDVSSGREFYMSGHSNGQCDSYGWMMVATKNGCPFESSSGTKPSFLYAPGNSMTHWSQTSAGKGDVFAILAHQDCNSFTTPRPTLQIGHSDACIYKQQVYRQGETWVDGCNYNCTCVDSTTGRYVCNSLCPVYNNLPPGCTLKKNPGECCSYPDCVNGILTNGQITGICVYKNKTYTQGQKWSDGCLYNCECTDGSLGKYICKEKCYHWDLPTVCTMDPPETGYCCSTPKCPSYVTITYPQGYVKQ